MNKRGQITIFIIIAILIISAVILVFILLNKNELEEYDNLDTDRVKSITEDYIENVAQKCLEKIGAQGGYNEIPIEIATSNTAYWYYEGINIQPFLNSIENETSNCINNELRNTTDKILESFNNELIEIDKNKINSRISINEKFVNVHTNYPIVISKDKAKGIISTFNSRLKIDLYELYKLATGIVNYASLPEFDKCKPAKCSSDNINFTFFNEKDDLIIKGETFLVFKNDTIIPYEMEFAIKRHIKEAFGENKKKLAVLYQEDKDLPTFGDKAKDIFNNKLNIREGIDYFRCDEISLFLESIDEYDVGIITGNLQFQIIKHSYIGSISGEEQVEASGIPRGEDGELLYGCNSFNDIKNKNKLKNWVNNGGILWINNVDKAESENYVVSYLGSLGYEGGGWNNLGNVLTLEALQNNLLDLMNNKKRTINKFEIEKSHPIITCPNEIGNKISGIDYYSSLKVTDLDEIIIGNQNNAKLWVRKLGNGVIVFDEFILTDNLYNRLQPNDLESNQISIDYFINVLNYISKFDQYQKNTKIELINPINDMHTTNLSFTFKSEIPVSRDYILNIIDLSGNINSININENNIETNKDTIKVDLKNSITLQNLENGRYEWNIIENYDNNLYYSNIDTFIFINNEEEDND
ncbi:hypothetical protein CMI46_00835 [Candidatus Pacearchaeota archaeon]|nr:hypothetical protein [Candidatus Pacearchaeota archaeon]|tara:strand:- start:1486 stop:3408 length:1923 start_codon:yes stop_codon:yes gene_type:complete